MFSVLLFDLEDSKFYYEMYRHSRVVRGIFNENVTEYSENKSRLNIDIPIKKTLTFSGFTINILTIKLLSLNEIRKGLQSTV